MNDFFRTLQKLTENSTWYCFQSQTVTKKYYNLMIVNPLGVKENHGADNFDIIALKLKVMWGHLLEEPVVARGSVKKTEGPVNFLPPSSDAKEVEEEVNRLKKEILKTMPTPAGFPMPPS